MNDFALPKIKKQRRKGRPKKISSHTSEELITMQIVLRARCKEMGWPVTEATLRRAKAPHLSNEAGREIERFGFDADLYDCVKSIHKIFTMHRQLCDAVSPTIDSCSTYTSDEVFIDPDARNHEPMNEEQKSAQYKSISEERHWLVYAISIVAGSFSSKVIDVIVDNRKPFPEFVPIIIVLYQFLSDSIETVN